MRRGEGTQLITGGECRVIALGTNNGGQNLRFLFLMFQVFAFLSILSSNNVGQDVRLLFLMLGQFFAKRLGQLSIKPSSRNYPSFKIVKIFINKLIRSLFGHASCEWQKQVTRIETQMLCPANLLPAGCRLVRFPD